MLCFTEYTLKFKQRLGKEGNFRPSQGKITGVKQLMDFYYVSIFKQGIKFYYTSTSYFSRRDWGDSQLRKQKHNCYFISTTAISLAQLQIST